MARGPEVTRYYLEVPVGDDPANWPDDRVWSELHTRLAVTGAEGGRRAVTRPRLRARHVVVRSAVVPLHAEPFTWATQVSQRQAGHVLEVLREERRSRGRPRPREAA
jgi:hypothetical protein